MHAAARRLPALARCGARTITRAHTWRPLSTAASIPHVLAAASANKPLKDAVKFIRPPPEKPAIWTYRELNTHVDALVAGLHELSYTPGQVLMVLLSPHSQEYPVTILAAAKLGISVVVVPTPADPSAVNVAQLEAALHKYRPRALFIGKEFRPAGADADHDGIVASVNQLLNALAPDVALRDAKGLNGFVPLTGRPFAAAKFPYLEHVVQTSDTNLRGALTFKSLLVYSGNIPTPPTGDAPLLVMADSGTTVTTHKVLADAEALGSDMSLSPDHTAKNGRLVITPSLTERSTTAMVSAVMHEALWVCPGEADSAAISVSENALVV